MTTPPVAAMLAHIEAALRPLADAQQAEPMHAYIICVLGIRANGQLVLSVAAFVLAAGSYKVIVLLRNGRRIAALLAPRGKFVKHV